MSTTLAKRSLAAARVDAGAFRAMFEGTFQRWEIAGSVRRGASQVGDVEHVVIPRFGEVAAKDGGGLFAETKTVSLLWERLDELVADRRLSKHLYTIRKKDGTTSVTPKWGEAYRGVDFNGFNHEIYTASADNWGPQLSIRTGPWEFSRMLVTALQRNGYVNDDGFVHDKNAVRCACGWQGPWDQLRMTHQLPGEADAPLAKFTDGQGRSALCPICHDGVTLELRVVPCGDERGYFSLCGVAWREPGERR